MNCVHDGIQGDSCQVILLIHTRLSVRLHVGCALLRARACSWLVI
eukprot:XP_001708550.1 Hypothetical protein GL50803_35638 [Giardia lamblia ATCC 50803]